MTTRPTKQDIDNHEAALKKRGCYFGMALVMIDEVRTLTAELSASQAELEESQSEVSGLNAQIEVMIDTRDQLKQQLAKMTEKFNALSLIADDHAAGRLKLRKELEEVMARRGVASDKENENAE